MSRTNLTPLREGRRFFLAAVSVAVLFAASAFILPAGLVLVVRNETRNEVLFRGRVTEGFEFATKIRHSVQLTPVYEYYRIESGGRLTVTGTKLRDLGWGMPSTEDARVVFKDGFMLFEGVKRKLDALRFRVSEMNDAALFIEGRWVELNSFTEDGDLLVFTVVREAFIPSLLKGDYHAF